MSTRDDNDLLRAGELPLDPFADAVRVGSSASVPETSPGQARESLTADGLTLLPRNPGEPVLGPAALHGLAGEIVRTIDPHTEAHPAGILAQLLVALGCMIGRTAHARVGATPHYLNIFGALVGPTGKGRKGTGGDEVRRLVEFVEPDFAAKRLASGLVSGEGVIAHVRDAVVKYVKDKKSGEMIPEEIDPGVTDKRILITETEFARTLAAIGREGNTLSPVLREAWDRGDLSTLGKAAPQRATGAHVAIVVHVTAHELAKRLAETELQNGLVNRFLWIWVRRTKQLPEGGSLSDRAREDLAARLKDVVEFAVGVRTMERDDEARALWRKLYPILSGDRVGRYGAATSRAEPQVLRLSCLYALLDRSAIVRAPHLRAALALWRYCEESAKSIFGDALGDVVADELARALREAGSDGLTKTQIRDLFHRHGDQRKLGGAVGLLLSLGLARREKVPTKGKPAEKLIWVGGPATEAIYAAEGCGPEGYTGPAPPASATEDPSTESPGAKTATKATEASEAGTTEAYAPGKQAEKVTEASGVTPSLTATEGSGCATGKDLAVHGAKSPATEASLDEDPFACLGRFGRGSVDGVPQRGVL